MLLGKKELIASELKGLVEKGHWGFLAKIKLCQNSSKFHLLVFINLILLCF